MVEEVQRFSTLLPLLHISTHGHSEGLQLSNEELIPWSELADLLVPINRALQSKLVVAMSCCEGYSAVRMAMRDDRPELPFHALVGSPEKPTWAETAVAFTTFYHQLARGAHLNDAVSAMRIALGRDSFLVEWGEATRQGYLDYIKKVDAEKVRQQLQDDVESQPPDETAKMALLEKGAANCTRNVANLERSGCGGMINDFWVPGRHASLDFKFQISDGRC
jgi:hypothetical protein